MDKYIVEITGVTHSWTIAETCNSLKEAEQIVKRAVKAGRNPSSIRISKNG